MNRKATFIVTAVGLFLVVTAVTWKVLTQHQIPPMSLPQLAFPTYPGAAPTSTGEPRSMQVAQANSLTEACSLFNTMVRETAARANFCRSDGDCGVQVHDVCALGCEYFFNKNVDIGSVLTAATVYQQQRCPECPKICLRRVAQNVVCRNNVCVVR